MNQDIDVNDTHACIHIQVLYPFSDRISEALRIVTKAIPLIQLYYGPKHMDILQLQNMIDICGTS